MAITFDKINKLIVITTDTEVTIQNLINAIRDYEDENENLEIASLANAYGKQSLGGGALGGITLELINDWRVKFEDRNPPDYIPCIIYGGNLVAINQYGNNPIKTSAYTQVTIAQSSSPTIVETGSGLTTEEQQRLIKIEKMLKWKL